MEGDIAWARISPQKRLGHAYEVPAAVLAQNRRGTVTLITTAKAVVARPLSTCASQRVNRAVEMGGGELDITILELARPAFCCEQGAAMHPAEITIGEFVVRLCPGGFLVVDAKVPFAVFGHPMTLDEPVLVFCRGLVLAPVVALVRNCPAVADQLLRMLEASPVDLNGHSGLELLRASVARSVVYGCWPCATA